MRTWYAVVNTADRSVVSLDQFQDNDLGALAPGLEHVEISRSDWGMISANQSFDDGIPAWDCAVNGTVTPRTDTRFNLVVTLTAPAVGGNPVPIDFALLDDQGAPVAFTGTRQVMVNFEGSAKLVNLALVNGQRSASPTLAAGTYTIASADPLTYKVSGDTTIQVGESW